MLLFKLKEDLKKCVFFAGYSIVIGGKPTNITEGIVLGVTNGRTLDKLKET